MLLHFRTRLNPKSHFGLLVSTSPSFRCSIASVASIEARLWQAKKAYELALSEGKSVAELDEALRLKLARIRYPGNVRLPCPCPYISTLQLELAISRHQWFLIPAKPEISPTWDFFRYVVRDSTVLGKSSIGVPFNALSKLEPNVWFTPYWNAQLNELRFRLQTGGDLNYAVPHARIGNVGTRALGKLAIAEGLIENFDETRGRLTAQDGAHIRAFNQDVTNGFQGCFEEWQVLQAKGRSAPSKIKTLVFSKGKESGQIFTLGRGGPIRRQVSVGGVIVGDVQVPTPLLSSDRTRESYCLDFDTESQVLRFRKPNGEIIPAPPFTLMQLARHYRPLLVLATKEGLISSVPDDRLHGFELHATIQRGFHFEVRNNPNQARRDRSIHVHLGNGKRANILIRLSVPPGSNVLRLVPYIDADQMLRVWNLGTEADMEMKVGVYTRSADEVRRMSPELFAFARSLGYWKAA